jgi:hypothetical protein
MSLAELRKIRHDRTELYMRAIQPALWLLIFGETFTRIRAIPTTGGLPYLDYLAPGVMAQSALFIAIFYGIQIIWERDFGILTKLLATPTPRAALVTGKAFAAGVRAISQVIVVLVLSALLGVTFDWNPLRLVAAVAVVVVVASAFFAPGGRRDPGDRRRLRPPRPPGPLTVRDVAALRRRAAGPRSCWAAWSCRHGGKVGCQLPPLDVDQPVGDGDRGLVRCWTSRRRRQHGRSAIGSAPQATGPLGDRGRFAWRLPSGPEPSARLAGLRGCGPDS